MTDEKKILDARGYICPIPVLKAQKLLKDMQTGEVLSIMVTDPSSEKEFNLFCKDTGHKVSSIDEQDDYQVIVIKLV